MNMMNSEGGMRIEFSCRTRRIWGTNCWGLMLLHVLQGPVPFLVGAVLTEFPWPLLYLESISLKCYIPTAGILHQAALIFWWFHTGLVEELWALLSPSTNQPPKGWACLWRGQDSWCSLWKWQDLLVEGSEVAHWQEMQHYALYWYGS